jgi:class 3 adenylate cyclase
MQQIADWLRKLGLGQHAQRFVDNEIDVSVLRHLTDQDLKDIGVPLGHRRKILAAISEAAGATAPTPETRVAPAPHDTAERRQVTVMFSDLVGSTALSARMDPEDLREIISSYQKCVAETVQRFGGFVAKYMGDGVLVYFGYPQAHEDDAERAVRGGLALIEAVGKLSSIESPQVRIGIGTGVVVVGDLVGAGEAQERGVVGETPNLAARLQAAATPSTIAIDTTTRRLLGGLFEYRDLGIEAKGFADRVQAYEVVRPSTVESRFEALRTATTPLVGREEEIALLLQRWAQAKAGEGCVVLIAGEAGIGKSRIAQAMLERLAEEPHTRLRYFCSAAPSGQRAVSGHCPIGEGGRFSPRGHGGRAARQARSAPSAGDQRCARGGAAHRRLAVDPERRTLPGSRPDAAEAQGEDARRVRCPGRGLGGAAATIDDVRGRALERPDDAGID